MYERFRDWLLRFLKVPPEPHPPFGDPASLRVFRAGRNYFRLRLFGWAIGQTAALAGIIFWVVLFYQAETAAEALPPIAPASGSAPANGPAPATPAAPAAVVKQFVQRRPRESGFAQFKRGLGHLVRLLPPWAIPVIWLLKLIGFLAYLAQLPLTYAIRRLDYEMRWYVVTDRSLRIRTGTWRVQELTMSFANLQQVVVTQGPLQRLLGLADVRVQSAGGGSGQGPQGQESSLHVGHFHGVENAVEIRDLILDRLRRFRESGLGDPEETHHLVEAVGPAGDVHAAALELAAEARALRQALE